MAQCMAHRGWSGKAPENTLSAIRFALEDPNVHSIEVDIQLTKDGVPILMHDFTLDRTTNGTGFVKDISSAELKTLDAGSWFHEKFAGEAVPTLEEALALVKGANKQLNIELKAAGDLYQGMERKVVSLVKQFQMENEVIITSFEHEIIKKIGLMTDSIRTGLIFLGLPVLLKEQIKETRVSFLSMAYPYVTKQLATEMAENGLELIAWTVDDVHSIETIKRLHESIIICTNFPDRLSIPML